MITEDKYIIPILEDLQLCIKEPTKFTKSLGMASVELITKLREYKHMYEGLCK